MSQSARKILERVQTWPPQDLEELADRAREIDAHRTGVYDLRRRRKRRPATGRLGGSAESGLTNRQ